MATLINDPARGEAVTLILAELDRAESIHPNYLRADAVRRVALVIEEAGEAMQAALDLTRDSATMGEQEEAADRLFNETIQAGAMCVKLISEVLRGR